MGAILVATATVATTAITTAITTVEKHVIVIFIPAILLSVGMSGEGRGIEIENIQTVAAAPSSVERLVKG